jgi:crotonobetainyl-CoA:carnitine CoA-transferase CaiB-like acyl-CoA transferase
VGQAVEVPMFETMSHFLLGDHMAGLSYRPAKGGSGYERLRHRRPYQTSDGYLCVLVYNGRQWKRFFDAIGRPEMMDDPRFATHAQRAIHIGEIYDLLEEILKQRTSAEWMVLLEQADIPFARMNAVLYRGSASDRGCTVCDAHANRLVQIRSATGGARAATR